MTERIYGVAVDAGSGLTAAISAARGANAQPDDPLIFKRAVLTELGPHASTVLLDASYGPELIGAYPSRCAPMLAYEADVYHISDTERITVIPDNLRVEDYLRLGVERLKFFMYYAPDDDTNLNLRKRELIADIGAQCAAHNLTFLLEPLVYHPQLANGTAAYAQAKPELVRRATAAFAAPELGAKVLKVEIPVDLDFVEGYGTADMSRDAAFEAMRNAADAAGECDLVYLSAGVTFERFEASLRLAVQAGVEFAGFMCGRAIWADAVPIFGAEGETGLRAWLQDIGRARLDKLINATQ